MSNHNRLNCGFTSFFARFGFGIHFFIIEYCGNLRNHQQFPLISNQQQALEIYQIARRQLDVNELYQEVNEQIRSAHELFNAKAQRRQSRSTEELTYVATAALIPSLAAGIVGMNYDGLQDSMKAVFDIPLPWFLHFPLLILGAGMLVWLLYLVIKPLFRKVFFKNGAG
jgi:Mg2+ and Co2+ transporter CorA